MHKVTGLLLVIALICDPACEALLPTIAMKGLWSSAKSATKSSTTDDTLDYGAAEGSSASSEEAIQASFVEEQRFWRGGPFVNLGSGIRYYKLGFIEIKVYGLALYVERGPAVQGLQRLKEDGFFANGDTSDERMCAALAAINCNKVAQVQLLRSISSSQFTGALAKSLKPRLADTDDKKYIPGFEEYFEQKSLSTGSNIPLMWTDEGQLQLDLLGPGQSDYQHIQPSMALPSSRFCQALFDIWFQADTPVRGAREQWAASARGLLNTADGTA